MIQSLTDKLNRIPRVGISRRDTPLEPMGRLSSHIGGPRLWVKREDMTGSGIGGNKLRKLDFLLHEAIAQGADTLVSGGVVQSNTQTQVAAAAAKLGLECHLAVFHGSIPAPAPDYELTGNARLNRQLGAHLHDVYWDGGRTRACSAICEALQRKGQRPFVVPYGASNALGAVAYASVLAEIAQQSNALGINPVAVVHTSVSAATQAGLAFGASLALPRTEVIGVDIGTKPARVQADTIRLAKGAANLLGVEYSKADGKVVPWNPEPHYGLPHKATLTAIELAASLESLTLDPVYSGKGLAGLMALIESGRWSKDSDVVFVHTGGVLSSPSNDLTGLEAAA